MYDVCTELSACIFGKDMSVDLIVIDTICRFLPCPGDRRTERQTLGPSSRSRNSVLSRGKTLKDLWAKTRYH